MNAWTSLLAKDFRLMRTPFLIGLLLLLVLNGAIYLFNMDGHPARISLAASFPLWMAHFFYLPVYIFFALLGESRTMHLWLHHPQRAWYLMSSKLVNALAAMAISLTINFMYMLVMVRTVMSDVVQVTINWERLFALGMIFNLFMLMVSLYLAMWIYFIWTIYQTSKTRFGKLSWLIVIAALLLPTWGMAELQSTALYGALAEWGATTVNLGAYLHSLFNNPDSFLTPAMDDVTISIYFGEIVFYLLVTAVLFLISGWLLDEKVEVA